MMDKRSGSPYAGDVVGHIKSCQTASRVDTITQQLEQSGEQCLPPYLRPSEDPGARPDGVQMEIREQGKQVQSDVRAGEKHPEILWEPAMRRQLPLLKKTQEDSLGIHWDSSPGAPNWK